MQNHLTPDQYAFIRYLTALDGERNRDVLAVLRRGLTGDPARDLNLYRFVARYVPDEDRGTEREAVYYLVAALYAFHPVNTDKGNFGDHMAQAARLRQDNEAAERRFTALLNARFSDLAGPLRQAVAMLKQQEEISVNWTALFSGLLHWNNPEKTVQRIWANGFWGFERPENTDAKAPAVETTNS